MSEDNRRTFTSPYTRTATAHRIPSKCTRPRARARAHTHTHTHTHTHKASGPVRGAVQQNVAGRIGVLCALAPIVGARISISHGGKKGEGEHGDKAPQVNRSESSDCRPAATPADRFNPTTSIRNPSHRLRVDGSVRVERAGRNRDGARVERLQPLLAVLVPEVLATGQVGGNRKEKGEGNETKLAENRPPTGKTRCNGGPSPPTPQGSDKKVFPLRTKVPAKINFKRKRRRDQ